jgi:hypothetical protein
MCPACMAATAIAAAKVASTGGLAAYGAKKLLTKSAPTPIEPTLTNPGDPNEATEHRVR